MSVLIEACFRDTLSRIFPAVIYNLLIVFVPAVKTSSVRLCVQRPQSSDGMSQNITSQKKSLKLKILVSFFKQEKSKKERCTANSNGNFKSNQRNRVKHVRFGISASLQMDRKLLWLRRVESWYTTVTIEV